MSGPASALRVLIADDHHVVRVGLRALLSAEPDMEIVGEAADGVSAVTQAQALRPDVLLLDLVLPGLDGVRVIEQVTATAPEVRVLVLTIYADDEHVFGALRAGAHGYLLKESAAAELIRAIRDVAAGTSSLDPAVGGRIVQGYVRRPPASTPGALTGRESDVLALVAQGLSNKAIASRLNLSERTVRTYVSGILAKLHLESRTQATLYALRNGIGRDDGQRVPE